MPSNRRCATCQHRAGGYCTLQECLVDLDTWCDEYEPNDHPCRDWAIAQKKKLLERKTLSHVRLQ